MLKRSERLGNVVILVIKGPGEGDICQEMQCVCG